MASTNTERKVLFHTWYQGRVNVEVVGRATLFGREYYEIRTEDGRTKTVPASMCTKQFINEQKNKE